MIKFKLNQDIIITKDSVTVGDLEIYYRDLGLLSQMGQQAGTEKYLNVYVNDLILVTKLVSSVALNKNTEVKEFDVNKKIHGVLVGTLCLLVNTTAGTYSYLPILGDGCPRGTLKITASIKDKIQSLINRELSTDLSNTKIKRDGVNVIIYCPADSEKEAYRGDFNHFIFKPLDDEGQDWSLGSMQMTAESKNEIIDKTNELFNYTEPSCSEVRIEACAYRSKNKCMNDLYGAVKDANKTFNTVTVNNATTEEISKAFWTSFYAKLELLYSRGVDIQQVLAGHSDLSSFYQKCNMKKLV